MDEIRKKIVTITRTWLVKSGVLLSPLLNNMPTAKEDL